MEIYSQCHEPPQYGNHSRNKVKKPASFHCPTGKTETVESVEIISQVVSSFIHEIMSVESSEKNSSSVNHNQEDK